MKSIIITLILFIPLSSSAKFYKCTVDGGITFQQTACVKGNQVKIKTLTYKTQPNKNGFVTKQDIKREKALAKFKESCKKDDILNTKYGRLIDKILVKKCKYIAGIAEKNQFK